MKFEFRRVFWADDYVTVEADNFEEANSLAHREDHSSEVELDFIELINTKE